MHDVARLRRLSRLMQAIVLVCGAFIAAGAVWFFAASLSDPGLFETLVRDNLSLSGPLAFTSSAIGVTAALIAVQFGLLFTALYCVWRMFGAFAAEEPLSGESAHWLRHASAAFVAVAAGSIVLRMLMILVLTMGNPAGQKMLAIGIGSAEMLSVLIACIMYMTGRLMALAAEVRAEQRDFV
ncbi:DUF2975 domain-containing protein [Nitratireductor rhodophyticola]|uniref:DUF2975 domain-containing protein n=1 Tax=Nitratireductor rhodophyticola TaxID=2854036 RepID=UPI002AC96885|nr:DUF2975 domain-containing protein [Nitratireductor rhodophyticola]WPZ15588.1 DUF2975 domain-containing protein [Nitratireductor rhodophyticola]